jgi:hypothetical protein
LERGRLYWTTISQKEAAQAKPNIIRSSFLVLKLADRVEARLELISNSVRVILDLKLTSKHSCDRVRGRVPSIKWFFYAMGVGAH